MKKILVVYYTQSGQMREIAESLMQPFAQDTKRYSIHYEALKPTQPFPFPWSAFRFFDVFPATFNQQPIAMQPYSQALENDYDLVVLAYQPWFLTPTPAMATFLQSDVAKKLLRDKPVVTILGCRNMWLAAQEKVKVHLQNAQAKLVGNIALVDKQPNVVSLFTILRWLLWGKKEGGRFLPAAGVAAADIAHAAAYGYSIQQALEAREFSSLQHTLIKQGAVEIEPELLLMEKRGQRAFGIWSSFIGRAPAGSFGRQVRVYIFMVLLPVGVLLLSPLLILISALLLRFNKEELMREVEKHKMIYP